MRKFSALLISLSLILNIQPASAAGDAFNPLNLPVGPGKVLQYIVEDGSVEKTSYLAIYPPAISTADQTRQGKWKWCAALTDAICDPKNSPTSMKATSVLGPCLTDTQEDCIASLSVNDGPTLQPAKLIRNIQGLNFTASPEYNFPGGSTISLWDAPSGPSASGTTTYAALVRLQYYFSGGKFVLSDLFTGVIPYRETRDSKYEALKINTSPSATPENLYLFRPWDQVCVFVEDGICGVAQDFAPNARVKIQIRLTKEVGGWFRGRIQDPSIQVSSFSSRTNLLTVEASPVTVPRMAYISERSAFNDQEKIWDQNLGTWATNDLGSASGAQAGMPHDAFPYLAYYKSKVNDTAINTNTFWNFSSATWGRGSACLTDTSKVLGMVTTNAMIYDGTSPSFENGTLNYKVAGLHYMPDGKTPVSGTYNLVMRSETARCLYGFTNAPISATVSVAGDNASTVATTVTGEKDGWLSMAASGFGFSEKTIQVKLTQEVAPVPVVAQPIATPAPVAVVAPISKLATVMVKKSITCLKGKTKKVVTGTSPKCPTGYKKI